MKSEFEFINDLKTRYSLAAIGDDCAVLPKDAQGDLLVTADMLVEDIDFQLEWTTPEFLGHKALAVSLSDIAAMGGTAKWALTSIGVAEKLWKTNFLDRFYEGLNALAQEHDVQLVGGDISKSTQKLVIDSIVGGEVPKGRAFLRAKAKPGDLIYMTGSLGGAAAGLKLLEQGLKYEESAGQTDELLLRQLKPAPQLRLANMLQQLQICHAAIDISDGLSSDLTHICEASGVGARIYAQALPLHPDLTHHFSVEQCLELALHGGEDFVLLYTISPNDARAAVGTQIGEITEGPEIELVDGNSIRRLQPRGFRHF